MNKKKVLYVMHGLAPGGIESFAINILENIDKEKIDISFALATQGKQFYEERVINAGGKIFKTSDLNGIQNIVKHFFRLIKLIKNEGPFDVVHSNIDFFNGINLLAAFIANVPIRISHSHNTHSAGAKNKRYSFFTMFYRFFMRILIKLFATHYLGCSNQANNYMYGNRWAKGKNSKVIYNGINMGIYSKSYYDKKLCFGKLLSNKNMISFLTIGRMCEQKNCIFIVDIINELFKIRKDIHFTWVGTGRLENEIKEKIFKYGIDEVFTFLGARNDIPEILAAADYFLFPSLWEGLPVALIEAQASGLECFISDSITEEANLGLCRVISLEKDYKIWAKEINNYINNKKFVKKIINEKLDKFDINITVKVLENIYLGYNT